MGTLTPAVPKVIAPSFTAVLSYNRFLVSLANNVDLCTRVNNHHQRDFLCVILQEPLIFKSLVHARSVDAGRVCGESHWHVFAEFRQARWE